MPDFFSDFIDKLLSQFICFKSFYFSCESQLGSYPRLRDGEDYFDVRKNWNDFTAWFKLFSGTVDYEHDFTKLKSEVSH